MFKIRTAMRDDQGWKSYTKGIKGVGIANPTPAWGSCELPLK